MKLFHLLALLLVLADSKAQSFSAVLDSFSLFGDVHITIDKPVNYKVGQETIIILYGLPNGSSTAHTMGKKMRPSEDERYDIQHVKAQTTFIRKELGRKNIVVCYLETSYKSWPLWKQHHPDAGLLVTAIVDTLYNRIRATRKSIYLNGHSGGGRFIFSYLAAVEVIPSYISRISFLDSNYGYDSTFTYKLVHWLKTNPRAHLNVFAYNDSIALYQGKPFVSPTGGTWYKSYQMLRDLAQHFAFQHTSTDSLEIYQTSGNHIAFFLKPNYDRGIYHTRQVEQNGFIHSILAGTRRQEKRYKYYGNRAYTSFIQ